MYKPLVIIALSVLVFIQTAHADAITRFIVSGGVTSDSVRVKAGFLENTSSARLAVSTSSNFLDSVYSAPVAIDLSVADGVGDFQVNGLNELTDYYYRIEVDGAIDDRVGQFQTFTNKPYSFSFISSACAALRSDPVFLAIRDEDPLFYMNVGDIHYSNIAINDTQLFYDKFEAVFTRDSQRALYESTSLVYMWDDHDYGPNNSDETSPSRTASRLAYRDYIPSYPLAAGPGDAPIQQSFSVGRVKFILTDLRSEKSAPSDPAGENKRTMSLEQEAWFFDELLDGRDNYAAIVWVSSYPWVGKANNSSDFWNGYPDHRDKVAGFIKDNGVDNLFMVSGDAHMLAIEDGSNNTYPDGQPGFPIFQTAALTSSGSTKGGPYSHGTFPGSGQYGRVSILDDGGNTVQIQLRGKKMDGTTLVSHDFSFDASHLQPTEIISGGVFEAGQPVEGVTIDADFFSTVTDASGLYSLPVTAGQHTLTASKLGYEITPQTLSIDTESSNLENNDFAAELIPVFSLNYTAGPGGSIQGDTEQYIEIGEDGSSVLALPNTGFTFYHGPTET